MGFISRVVTTGLVALAAGGSYHLLTERHLAPSSTLAAEIRDLHQLNPSVSRRQRTWNALRSENSGRPLNDFADRGSL